MSGEGLDPLKRYIVKGIAGGIGLASESISTYKARKRMAANETSKSIPIDCSPPSYSPPSYSPPSYSLSSSNVETQDMKKSPEVTELSATSEEALWELDENQTQYQEPHGDGRKSSTQQGYDNIQAFLVQYPPPSSKPRYSLSLPVILPQRRPKTRTRGFVRAYAPVLNDCAISQDMFLDFLETFHRSSQASPWINAVNLASFGLTFIPHFPMLVGLAIQASCMVAEDVQSRSRANSFLDKANAEIFHPRGLFCLVMAYDPNAVEVKQDVPLHSTIASRLNPSGIDKIGNKLKVSSGTTLNEMDFPEAAPLVFPMSDVVSDDSQSEGSSTKEKLGKKKKYVDEYFDKRARAKFAGKHPDSVLAQGPQPTFTSRYADPNHPAASGSFRSLITGGLIKPPPMYQPGSNPRDQVVSSRAGFFSNPPAPYGGSSPAPYGGNPPAPYGGSSNLQHAPPVSSRQTDTGLLGLPSPGGLIKKALKNNVLYLMIVNMPTDDELAEAMAEIETRRRQGFNLSSILGRL